MSVISDAERLALITHAQVDLVLKEAEIAEDEARAFSKDRARQRGPVRALVPGGPAASRHVLIIDWSTGERAVYSDNVIPFPHREAAGPTGQRKLNR